MIVTRIALRSEGRIDVTESLDRVTDAIDAAVTDTGNGWPRLTLTGDGARRVLINPAAIESVFSVDPSDDGVFF